MESNTVETRVIDFAGINVGHGHVKVQTDRMYVQYASLVQRANDRLAMGALRGSAQLVAVEGLAYDVGDDVALSGDLRPGRTVFGQFNTDNDSAFKTDTEFQCCKDKHVEFTRSRPDKKNDQAWVGQKNGSLVRRRVGYSRLSGGAATALRSPATSAFLLSHNRRGDQAASSRAVCGTRFGKGAAGDARGATGDRRIRRQRRNCGQCTARDRSAGLPGEPVHRRVRL